MARCVIEPVSLEPYSREQVFVVCGYTYGEFIEWFNDEHRLENHSNNLAVTMHKLRNPRTLGALARG